MALLDNKALKIDGIVDFTWSPSDNVIAFWVPEKDPKPARVTLLSIPKKEEVSVKNLYNVVTVCRESNRN
jgi:translation initiation factor 3 subunit B